MRNPVFAFGSRNLCNAALVVALAGLSASCSNSLRLQEPFFTGSTENQREIIGRNDQLVPAHMASNAVDRSDLPAPEASYASTEPNSMPSYDADGQGSYGWSAVGGKVITVAPGETLDNLAVKFGVPGGQILSANQMTSATQIRRGKVLVIPRRVAIAPDQTIAPVAYDPPAAEPAPRMIAAKAGTYVVQPGDTLFSVARRSGTKAGDIASLNGFTTDYQLKVGQTLRLKNGAAAMAANAPGPKVLGAPEKPLGTLVVSNEPKIRLASPADTAETGTLAMNLPKVPAMPTIPLDRQNPGATPSATAVNASAIDDAADAASSDGKSFRWPVRGRIISGFGTKPNGERNDGINLAVPEGTSVKAVETGTVIYAGNELEGYGNLVLVRHADGWVSAYAHNKDILVKRGDQIRRGQTVAHAGMSGSVTSPQVHFELRKGAKPVNPLDYLAGA